MALVISLKSKHGGKLLWIIDGCGGSGSCLRQEILCCMPCWSAMIGGRLCWQQALSQLRQDVQGDAIFCCHAVLPLCWFLPLSSSPCLESSHVKGKGVVHLILTFNAHKLKCKAGTSFYLSNPPVGHVVCLVLEKRSRRKGRVIGCKQAKFDALNLTVTFSRAFPELFDQA